DRGLLAGHVGISFGRAHALAALNAQEVRRAGMPSEHLTPPGGLRRDAPSVEHVALLASAPADARAEVLDGFASLIGRAAVRQRFPDRMAFVTERGPVEVHLAATDTMGPALAWHTGSADHVSQL